MLEWPLHLYAQTRADQVESSNAKTELTLPPLCRGREKTRIVKPTMTKNPKETDFDTLAEGIKITYSIKHLPCSNPGCLTCLTSKGHGPYWYAQYSLDGSAKNVFLGRKFKPLDLASLIQRSRQAQASTQQMNAAKSTYSLKEKFQPMPTISEFQRDVRELKALTVRGNAKGLYRQLIKKYHPDQYNGNPQMNRWMSEINGLFKQLTATQPA